MLDVFGGFVAGFMLLMLLLAALFVFLFVFWILMIVDCAKRDFEKSDERVVWILVIVLLGFIGAIIYYFAVKLPDKNKVKKKK